MAPPSLRFLLLSDGIVVPAGTARVGPSGLDRAGPTGLPTGVAHSSRSAKAPHQHVGTAGSMDPTQHRGTWPAWTPTSTAGTGGITAATPLRVFLSRTFDLRRPGEAGSCMAAQVLPKAPAGRADHFRPHRVAFLNLESVLDPGGPAVVARFTQPRCNEPGDLAALLNGAAPPWGWKGAWTHSE
jgi:hypothetical protein